MRKFLNTKVLEPWISKLPRRFSPVVLGQQERGIEGSKKQTSRTRVPNSFPQVDRPKKGMIAGMVVAQNGSKYCCSSRLAASGFDSDLWIFVSGSTWQKAEKMCRIIVV